MHPPGRAQLILIKTLIFFGSVAFAGFPLPAPAFAAYNYLQESPVAARQRSNLL
jgi:hypothetical protein